MTYYLGIDIGSTSTQLIVLDGNKHNIAFLEQTLTGPNINQTGHNLIANAKKTLECQDKNFVKIVATGYGRKLFQAGEIPKADITEITCYAKGAFFLNNKVRTIIDIGGQDSKAISLDNNGAVKNFVMNDKCAAGTGKFLEMVARQFDMPLSELSKLSAHSTKIISISNICAVFAQSEIINLISKGIKIEDIVKAVEISIVYRTLGMAERIGINDEVMFCGGVANNQGMVTNLQNKLSHKIFLPQHVEFVGALGAALFAVNIQ